MPKRKRDALNDDNVDADAIYNPEKPTKRIRTDSTQNKQNTDSEDDDLVAVQIGISKLKHTVNENENDEIIKNKLENVVICDSCKNEYHLNDVNISNHKLRFINNWYCAKCKDAENKITYKCDIENCQCNNKSWKRFSTLQKHYIHKLGDPDHDKSMFLQAFSYKLCSGDNCQELLDRNGTSLCPKCIKHNQFEQFNNFGNPFSNNLNDENLEEEKQIIDEEPTFYQIFTSPLKWMNKIPQKKIKSVIKAYAYLVNNVVKHNDKKAWLSLSLFCKTVLAKFKRTGKSHYKRNLNSLQNRINMVLTGDIFKLYAQLMAECKASNAETRAKESKQMQIDLTCSELSSVLTLSSVRPRPESCFDLDVLAVSVDPPPSSRPCNTEGEALRKRIIFLNF